MTVWGLEQSSGGEMAGYQDQPSPFQSGMSVQSLSQYITAQASFSAWSAADLAMQCGKLRVARTASGPCSGPWHVRTDSANLLELALNRGCRRGGSVPLCQIGHGLPDRTRTLLGALPCRYSMPPCPCCTSSQKAKRVNHLIV